MLRKPQDFEWVQFEATPEDILGKFYLDDICIQHKDGTYTFLQIKHRQPSTPVWTWEDLLSQEKGKKGNPKYSLIQKWHKSIADPTLKGKIRDARLITNGDASTELLGCLVDNKVNIKVLRETYPKILDRIIEQLGTSEETDYFLSLFTFRFSEKDFESMEEDTRAGFRTFGATKDGLNSLLLKIHEECQKSQTEPWTLQTITTNCEFSVPEHLNEDFFIPPDFQIFDVPKHSHTLERFKDINGGLQVLFGTPGAGKSTYLAWLYGELKNQGTIVLHHHYHINPSDPNPQERLSAHRVIEALKAQCKEHQDLLGQLIHTNAANVSLREFLSQIASEAHSHKKAIVLIIDGLDHALRYEDSRQLTDLLFETCIPQKGLWILLGTQRSAKTQLPQVVFDACPEPDWIEIKGLTQSAISSLVKANITKLQLPDNSSQLDELCDAIFKLCGGNPLHLRYILNTLHFKKKENLVTEYDCHGLLPYSEDIERYYAAIWRALPDLTKSLALVFVSASFEPTEKQLSEIASALGLRVDQISSAMESILHLLKNRHGYLSIFHNSFRDFLGNTSEFSQQQTGLKRKILDWLHKSDYESLKWGHERILANDLGDPAPLLEIDRNWVINALSFPRQKHLIEAQLSKGAEAAFTANNWAKCLELGTWHQYLSNVSDYLKEYFIPAWSFAFELSTDKEIGTSFDSFSHEQLVVIGKELKRKGRFSEFKEDILSSLNEKHNKQDYRGNGEIGGRLPGIAISTIDILVLNDNWDVTIGLEYVRQYTSLGWNIELLGRLTNRVIELKQYSKLAEIAKQLCNELEYDEFYLTCAKYGIASTESVFSELFKNFRVKRPHPLSILFCELKGIENSQPLDLAPYLALPDIIPEYDVGHRDHRANVLYEGFIIGIVCGLRNTNSIVQAWEAEADQTWAHRAYLALVNAGVDIGKQLKDSKPVNLLAPLYCLKDVKPLDWPGDRDRLEYQHSLRVSLSKIFEILLNLRGFQKLKVEITDPELAELERNSHFGTYNLIDFLVSLSQNILPASLLGTFLEAKRAEIRKSNNTFSERSAQTLKLAKIALCHLDSARAKSLLWDTLEYLLGYGSHKDPFLSQVMDAVKCAHTSSPGETKGHIEVLGPLAISIRAYTDGDDTRYFPEYLAETLEKTLPEYLPGYFIDQTEAENYHLAEDIFKSIIRSIDLSDPFSFALATTAIDEGAFSALKKLAATTPLASAAVSNIKEYFGEIPEPKAREYSTPYIDQYKDEDFDSVSTSDINSKIETIVNAWEKPRFLANWAKFKCTKDPSKKAEVFKVLAQYIERIGEDQVEADVLDIAYDLALHTDRDKSFQYVTWAQANSTGWASYFSHEVDAQRRWEFIHTNFPDRYEEFFLLSIKRTGMRFGRKPSYFIPIPRGVEYLSLFGQTQRVKEITKASVELVRILVIDPPAQKLPWLNAPLYDSLDLLLQRLSWPSPLVRERAASALAELLSKKETSVKAKERLLIWISKQKLESMIVYGLLPFAKFAASSSATAGLFTIPELTKSITITAITINALMDYIAAHLNEEYIPETSPEFIIKPPVGYTPNAFFLKFVSSFLPTIYFRNAKAIERMSREPFISDWCNTAELIQTELKLENDRNSLDFMGPREDNQLVAIATKQSEVYRSAYLRCLEEYYRADKISEEYYLDYSFITIPVDVSLWRINPNRKPTWWPGEKSIPPEKISEGLPGISYESEIQSILQAKGKTAILALNGQMTSASDLKTFSEISLIGFGYKNFGPSLPSPEEIWDALIHNGCELTPPSSLKMPIAHFESSSDYLPFGKPSIQLNDTEITRLVGVFGGFTTPIWQWFRAYYSAPFGLSKDVFPAVNLSVNPDRLIFSQDGQQIASSYDWTDGILERNNPETPPSSGHYIEIDRDYLDSKLNSIGARLAFAVKVKVHVKEDNYKNNYKCFQTIKVLNLSRIIKP